MKERFYFAIEWGASDYHFLEISAKGFHELVSDFGIDCAINQRHGESPAHGAARNHRYNLLAVDFFENQGDAYHQIGFHLCHGGQEQARCRCFAEKSDECADCQWYKHVESAAVGMGERQERQCT